MSGMSASELAELIRSLRALAKASAHARWLKGRPRKRAADRAKRLARAEANRRACALPKPLQGLSLAAGPPIPPGGDSTILVGQAPE